MNHRSTLLSLVKSKGAIPAGSSVLFGPQRDDEPYFLPLACMCADDRLVTILRHHNFLRELQEIAVQGELQLNTCRWLSVSTSLFMKTGQMVEANLTIKLF